MHLHNESSSGRLASSEDELENNEKDGGGGGAGSGGALGVSSSGMEDDNQGQKHSKHLDKLQTDLFPSHEICIQVLGTVGIG